MESVNSIGRLQTLSYRCLQRMAKQAGLPANVKKSCLIDLIQAKNFKNQSEVDMLVLVIKAQRANSAKNRAAERLRSGGIEDEEISLNNTRTRQLRRTPRCSKQFGFRYSPEIKVVTYKSQKTVTKSSMTTTPMRIVSKPHTITSQTLSQNKHIKALKYYASPKTRSISQQQKIKQTRLGNDASLSNNNVKNLRGNNNSAIYQRRQIENEMINILGQDGVHKFSLSAYINKRRTDNTQVKVRQTVHSTANTSRKRTVSGISPLSVPERTQNTHDVSTSNTENMTIQEPFTPFTSEVNIENAISDELSQNCLHNDDSSLRGLIVEETYYDKVRTDTVVSQVAPGNEGLPRIVDMFANFNKMETEVTQPIYVRVSEEEEMAYDCVQHVSGASVTNSYILERHYNIRSSNTINQTVPKNNTKSVYITPIMVTAIVQAPARMVRNEYNLLTTYPLLNQNQCHRENGGASGFYDYLDNGIGNETQEDLTCKEVLSVSSTLNSSLQCSQELGANVTIPEMVEDALEIISQDGDYMERIGMEKKMHCVLCNWAGTQFLLEYHVRQEHSSDILKQDLDTWNITCTLGSLSKGQWLCKVIEYECKLYVFSGKYEEPDTLMATFHVLHLEEEEIFHKVKITVYNGLTGEPHIWVGNIDQLPDTMPRSFEGDPMRMALSKLDILPGKAVVGQSAFNDIQVIFFIELLK